MLGPPLPLVLGPPPPTPCRWGNSWPVRPPVEPEPDVPEVVPPAPIVGALAPPPVPVPPLAPPPPACWPPPLGAPGEPPPVVDPSGGFGATFDGADTLGTNRSAVTRVGGVRPNDSAIIRAPAATAPPSATMPSRRLTVVSASAGGRGRGGRADRCGRSRDGDGGRPPATPSGRSGAMRVRPLQLGDARLRVGAPALSEFLAEGGWVLADGVDPLGPVDRRHADREACGGRDRRRQCGVHLGRVDPGRAGDRQNRGRPDHDELGVGSELRDGLNRGDADRVVEDDHVGWVRRDEARELRSRRSLAGHLEPVVLQRGPDVRSRRISAPDDDAYVALVQSRSLAPGRPQRTSWLSLPGDHGWSYRPSSRA